MAITGIVLSIIGLMATVANAAIGAYMGATGKNQVVNEILNNNNNQQNSASTTQQGPYVDTKAGFSIEMPTGWQINNSGAYGTLVIATNPQTDTSSGSSTPFHANINIISQPVNGYSLKSIVTSANQADSKSLQNYQTTGNTSITVDNLPAYIIGGTFTQGQNNIQNLQLIVVNKGQVYIVTGSALQSDWLTYKDEITSSLTSLKFH